MQIAKGEVDVAQIEARDYDFVQLATVFIIPEHLLGEETNLKECQFNYHPVGTGPF